MSAPIIISVGDPAGVGPLVAVRAAGRLAPTERFVLFGDARRLDSLVAREVPEPQRARLRVVDVGAASDAAVEAHAATEEGGRHQLAALDAAIDACARGEGRALVTGPTSKEAIALSGTSFTGQTEHLAGRAALAPDDVTMLFIGPRLSVGLVTTHLALREVPAAITAARVERTILHLAEAMAAAEACSRLRRVGVTGLNPHAGEGGLFGDEEAQIAAGIRAAAERLGGGVALEGPLGAETAFRRASDRSLDGVVACFHDQATIASKLLDWSAAVNVTWGLPFVRTSVDHGVAYDAARSGSVEAAGMEAALRLAMRLVPA